MSSSALQWLGGARGVGNEGAVGRAAPASRNGVRSSSLCQRIMGGLHIQVLKGNKMERGFRVLHGFPNHVEFYNRSLRGWRAHAHAGGCREHPGSIVPRTRSVEQRPAFRSQSEEELPLEFLASGLDWWYGFDYFHGVAHASGSVVVIRFEAFR